MDFGTRSSDGDGNGGGNIDDTVAMMVLDVFKCEVLLNNSMEKIHPTI